MDKFKIEVILRNSPEKIFFTNIREKSYRLSANHQCQPGVFYARSPYTSIPSTEAQ